MNPTNQEIQATNIPQEDSQPQSTSSRITRKRFVIGLIILLICLLIPLGLYYSPHKQVPVDILLAAVGNQKIYKSAVEKAAEEQYAPSVINNTVLKRFFDIVVERAILDNEAKKLNITVSPAEINAYLTANHLSVKGSNIAIYAILKDKIIASQTKNVSAYSIGFFFSSGTSSANMAPQQKTASVENALNQAQAELVKAKPPFDVAKDLYNAYVSVKPIVSLNGHTYFSNETGDESFFVNPKLYTFNNADIQKLGYPEFYTTLSIMKNGDIKQVIASEGYGGNVIKVVAKSSGGFTNYNDFLVKKKQELLKKIHSL